jgi:hypothetical protein
MMRLGVDIGGTFTDLVLVDESGRLNTTQVIFHAGTMSTVIKSIIKSFSKNPSSSEGDMIIPNNPYRGAIHQPDMSIVAPVFREGRHVARTGSCTRQLDLGDMSFGSWASLRQNPKRRGRASTRSSLPGMAIISDWTLNWSCGSLFVAIAVRCLKLRLFA